jgi:hypothetical protein
VRDKSAPTGIRGICLKPIIGGVHDKSAPTGVWGILLISIIGGGRNNALSKINTDYEISLYAAMASFIIHIYF